jgi:hypothetical protein
MAIKLVQETKIAEYVKLISVVDDAIDWDASYQNAEKKEDETTEEAKKRAHVETRDYSQVVYLEGKEPTVFVFKNPKLLENSRSLSNIQMGVAGVGRVKNEACDLWYRTFDVLCVGTAENMLDEPKALPRDKHTKMLTREVQESLSAQGIVSEMAGILIGISTDKGSKKS